MSTTEKKYNEAESWVVEAETFRDSVGTMDTTVKKKLDLSVKWDMLLS